jgi:hypothetical protein
MHIKYSIVKHHLKQKHITIQIIECVLIPIDIIVAICKTIYKLGVNQLWLNLSYELRRNYIATHVFAASIRNMILHRIGITISDPTGKAYNQMLTNNKYPQKYITSVEKQYLHHLNPVVRRLCEQYIDWNIANGAHDEFY